MNESDHIIQESPIWVGADETVTHSLTTTPWGSSPTGVAVKLYDNTGTDVSSTKLSGSASVNGDVITLPAITGLTAGAEYRLEVKFTVSGNTVETWADVYGRQ